MSETVEKHEQLLTVKEVAARCGVSARTILRWSENLDHFPKPGKFERTVRWRESEVNEFVSNFGKSE